jgi:hypothetical protein
MVNIALVVAEVAAISAVEGLLQNGRYTLLYIKAFPSSTVDTGGDDATLSEQD